MDEIVTANALSKQYGSFRALKDLSMHVPRGSIYGIVGKNGAGKTTLIRLLCGLQNPTSGEYTLYGVLNTSREIKKARRRMGAVVESPSAYLEMTAEDNVKEQYRILGLPSFEGVPELLQLVGLSDTGKKKVKNFSLGMRQRLGIALALAGDPDLLVLDEPANGLDPQGIVEMRELILRLNREREITVILSSHILDELSRLATHYGFLDKGHMVKEISAQDLEAACRRCVRVEVTDIKVLSRVLETLGMEYEIRSDQEADIFAKVNITRLVLALHEEGCELLSIREREESLENYYINLVGGGKR